MLVLPLKVHRSVVAKFKRRCKELFPLENFGYLLGNKQLNSWEIAEIWIPEDIKNYVTSETIYWQNSWVSDVLEYCEEHDLTPLGSIHSHPYTYSEIKRRKTLPDHSTSEADSLSGLTSEVHGICRVLESKTRRLTATVRFWGPELTVTTSYV